MFFIQISLCAGLRKDIFLLLLFTSPRLEISAVFFGSLIYKLLQSELTFTGYKDHCQQLD